MDQEQLIKLLSILRRHGWIVVQSVVAVGVITGLVAARAPEPPWVASSSLVYDVATNTSDASDPTAGLAGPFLRRQAVVMSGTSFLRSVAARVPGTTVDQLRANVAVRVDPQSNVILFSAKGRAPDRPLALVTAMAEAFVGSPNNDITRSLRDRSADLERQIESLEKRLDAINARLIAARAEGTDETLVEAQQQAALSQYTSLFGAQQKILNQIAVQRRPMVVLDSGTVRQKARPNALKRGLFGAFVGFVLGCGLLALRHVLDSKVRTPEQAVELSGLSLIGEIARPRRRRPRSRRKPGDLLADPLSEEAEEYRKIRTSLLFQRADHRLASIAVVGVEAAGDTERVAANLAATFASSRSHVLLVSQTAELLSSTGGVTTTLADLLVDEASPEALHTKFEGLNVAAVRTTAAVRHGELSVLLTSPEAFHTLSTFAATYDVVVFDCSSLTPSEESAITAFADATVLVTALHRSRAGALARATRQLRLVGAVPVGQVLTNCGPPTGYASPAEDPGEGLSAPKIDGAGDRMRKVASTP